MRSVQALAAAVLSLLAVSDAALDLRPAELGVVVPLVACLLALSAWPAAITQHSFRGDHGQADVTQGFK